MKRVLKRFMPKTLRFKGSRVYIRGVNADINKVFAMTGFSNLFEFK